MHYSWVGFFDDFPLGEDIPEGSDHSFLQMIEAGARRVPEVDSESPVEPIQECCSETGNNDVHDESSERRHEIVGYAVRFRQCSYLMACRPTELKWLSRIQYTSSHMQLDLASFT